jgi:hypothetical protein
MKSFLSVIAILTLSISLNAAEVSFEEPVVPSAFIKAINIKIRVNKYPTNEIYNKQLIIDNPNFINTIYFLTKKNISNIRKDLDRIIADKKTNSLDLFSARVMSEYTLNTNILDNLLAWATSSLRTNSFVEHLGEFLSSLQKQEKYPIFQNRSLLLGDAMFFSQFFGFAEMTEALGILLEINGAIQKQLKPGNYSNEYIAEKILPQFSDKWKRIAQLDVEFAKRIDPAIVEKMLAQPKYANALTSTVLTDADRNKMVELDLLIKAMKTLQEDAYDFYPEFIYLPPSASASQEKKD